MKLDILDPHFNMKMEQIEPFIKEIRRLKRQVINLDKWRENCELENLCLKDEINKLIDNNTTLRQKLIEYENNDNK